MLEKQILNSRVENPLSDDDMELSVGVGVFAVSSLADHLLVFLGKGHRKAECGKSAHPVLQGGEIFSLFYKSPTVKFEL